MMNFVYSYDNDYENNIEDDLDLGGIVFCFFSWLFGIFVICWSGSCCGRILLRINVIENCVDFFVFFYEWWEFVYCCWFFFCYCSSVRVCCSCGFLVIDLCVDWFWFSIVFFLVLMYMIKCRFCIVFEWLVISCIVCFE